MNADLYDVAIIGGGPAGSTRAKEFLDVFLTPSDTVQIAAAVNAVLAGNDGKSLAIKWRMWLFYFFIWVQRHFPIVPRLSLVSKTPELSTSPEAVSAAS